MQRSFVADQEFDPVIPGNRMPLAPGECTCGSATELLRNREPSILKPIAYGKSNERIAQLIDIASKNGMQSERMTGQVAGPG